MRREVLRVLRAGIMMAEQEAKALKRESVFYWTRAGVVILFLAALLALFLPEWNDRWATFLVFAYFSVQIVWNRAGALATFVCRKKGLSLDGTAVQRVIRVEDGIKLPAELPFVVERGSSKYIFPICATLLGVFFFNPFLLIGRFKYAVLEQMTLATLLFSMFAAAALISWRNVSKQHLAMDARGIAYCSVTGVTSHFIPWNKIARCDNCTTHNVFGEVTRRFVVLKDTLNKNLATIELNSSSPEINRANMNHMVFILHESLTGSATAQDTFVDVVST